MNHPAAWENVYIFISSTFNDMHAERDYLIKRVFPAVRAFCGEHRLNLLDVDLRWGITEEDAAKTEEDFSPEVRHASKRMVKNEPHGSILTIEREPVPLAG